MALDSTPALKLTNDEETKALVTNFTEHCSVNKKKSGEGSNNNSKPFKAHSSAHLLSCVQQQSDVGIHFTYKLKLCVKKSQFLMSQSVKC